MSLKDVLQLEFSGVVSESVTSIYIDSIIYEDSPDLPQIISSLKTKLVNLQEIKVGSYDSSQIKNELFDVLFNPKLGVKLPNICSRNNFSIPVHLTKNNMLVYYKEDSKIRMMKAKTGELDLQIDGSNILYADSEFIVLRNFDQLTLEDINVVPHPQYEIELFEQFLRGHSEVNKIRKCVIIQNQNFDEIDLNLSYCKYMKSIDIRGTKKMNIYLPMIGERNISTSDNISELVSTIQQDCDLSLKIDMNYQMSEFHMKILSDLLSLRIHHINFNVNQDAIMKLDEELKEQVVEQIMALKELAHFKFHRGNEDYHLSINTSDDNCVDKLQNACEHIFNHDNDSTFESDFIDDIEIL